MALIKKSKLNPATAPAAVALPPVRPPARNGQPNGAARRDIRPSPGQGVRAPGGGDRGAGERPDRGVRRGRRAAPRRWSRSPAAPARRPAPRRSSSSAIKQVVANLTWRARQAEASRRRTEAVEVVLAETATQIGTSVRAIERNGARQGASVDLIRELERRAQDIGEITRAVSRISDQTNLLALNAAIEAARAGDHGRGFAVVADEVRALAETSEKSAQEVQKLADAIQADVRDVAARPAEGRRDRDQRSRRPARGGRDAGCAARRHAARSPRAARTP